MKKEMMSDEKMAPHIPSRLKNKPITMNNLISPNPMESFTNIEHKIAAINNAAAAIISDNRIIHTDPVENNNSNGNIATLKMSPNIINAFGILYVVKSI